MSDRILATARAELERVRLAPSTWSMLDLDPVDGDAPADRNEARRASVLWALQYDRREVDLPLLRRVVEQEARWRRAVGGLGPTAELAGYLLAEHRRVEDVWRHAALKDANFDAACCYDGQYLLAAGIAETIEHVRGSDHPDRDQWLAYLSSDDAPWTGDPELGGWWAGKRRWFPADPAEEDPLTWVDRAVLLGDLAEARDLLDRWSAAQPRDSSTLTRLSYRREELGEFAAAADALREKIARYPDDGGSGAAGELQRLAALERRAGRLRPAWEALSRSAEAMSADPDWPRFGLGHAFVSEAVQLAELTEPELAGPIWGAAERAAGRVAIAVAAWSPERAEHYRAVRAEAARRAAG